MMIIVWYLLPLMILGQQNSTQQPQQQQFDNRNFIENLASKLQSSYEFNESMDVNKLENFYGKIYKKFTKFLNL